MGSNDSLIVLEWREIGSALSIRASGMTRTSEGEGEGEDVALAGVVRVIGERDVLSNRRR